MRKPSTSPRAAKYWKVPTRRWLASTRVSTAPGKTVSRSTRCPVVTAARARVVGTPSAAMASLTMYSRKTGPSAALPSPRRENGVGPHHLPQQVGAAVAELRHEVPELVPGIGDCQRLGPLGHAVAGQDLHAFR